MSKFTSMNESKHVYCTETLRSVVSVKDVSVTALIDSDSKINLMNEDVIQRLSLQMRLNFAVQMMKQTSQEIQIVRCCEDVSVIIENVITYIAFMIVEYDDQDFILERS